MIAEGESVHALAQLDHFSGGLVAEDQRRRHRDRAVGRRKIGMADAAGAELDGHFAAPRRLYRDLLDHHRLVQLPEHHCFCFSWHRAEYISDTRLKWRGSRGESDARPRKAVYRRPLGRSFRQGNDRRAQRRHRRGDGPRAGGQREGRRRRRRRRAPRF